MRLRIMALTLIAAISSAGLVRAAGPQKMITVAANGKRSIQNASGRRQCCPQ